MNVHMLHFLFVFQMLAAAADPSIGGRDFDRILAEHFAKEFLTKYKVDAMKNPR